MYIIRTYYSYAVCQYGKIIMEFASYSEAREYINTKIKEKENKSYVEF